jgi:putative ABC transport system ATP-binding protein
MSVRSRHCRDMSGRNGLVLVARGVRRVHGDVVALHGVDLELRTGELVAVTGPSGSGKTTLLHCLAGLDRPDDGTVLVHGRPLHALPARERARHTAIVLQSGNLLPVLSAVENVEVPLLLRGERPRRARPAALAALTRVGLAARAHHRPAELSGGEQQRVAIARALAADPAVLWADEPTASLDARTAATVCDLLCELPAAGMTVVTATHDPAVADRAHRRLHLSDGRLAAAPAPAHAR